MGTIQHKRGCLYYLKNIILAKNASYDLHTLHKILGYSNKSDIKKSPKSVKGMKIKPTPNYTCYICIQGKMTENITKTLDQKVTGILSLVHCDLAGSIQPPGKEN